MPSWLKAPHCRVTVLCDSDVLGFPRDGPDPEVFEAVLTLAFLAFRVPDVRIVH